MDKRMILVVTLVVSFSLVTSLSYSTTHIYEMIVGMQFLDGYGNQLNDGYIIRSTQTNQTETFNLPAETSRIFEQYTITLNTINFTSCIQARDNTRIVRTRYFRDEDNNLTKVYGTKIYPDECNYLDGVDRYELTFPSETWFDGLPYTTKDYLTQPLTGDDFVEAGDWIRIEYDIQVRD
mgnify:CR=1 FL=1